jgi:hypothetical protein
MWTDDNGSTEDLFDSDTMRDHIEFIKKTHKQFVDNEDLDDYHRWYRRRHFYRVISEEASYNIIERDLDLDADEDDPRVVAVVKQANKSLKTWFHELERLHNAVMQCLPKVKNQLMGEQISRQTVLNPDVMKNIMEFANAKDPKRIVLDSAANKGVALPRAGRRTRRTKRRGTSRARRR